MSYMVTVHFPEDIVLTNWDRMPDVGAIEQIWTCISLTNKNTIKRWYKIVEKTYDNKDVWVEPCEKPSDYIEVYW